MTKLQQCEQDVGELTLDELTLVVGGAEPTHNRPFSMNLTRTTVKDSHDRYANIEVSYLR